MANIGEVSSPGTPLTRVQVANSSSQQPRNTSYTDTGGQQEWLAAPVPFLHGYMWPTGAISSPCTPHTQVQVAYSSSQQPRYTSYTGTCSLQQRSTSQVHLLHGYRWPRAAINSPGTPLTWVQLTGGLQQRSTAQVNLLHGCLNRIGQQSISPTSKTGG